MRGDGRIAVKLNVSHSKTRLHNEREIESCLNSPANEVQVISPTHSIVGIEVWRMLSTQVTGPSGGDRRKPRRLDL